ncbi:MAG: YybH family protein [Methylocella sp.]
MTGNSNEAAIRHLIDDWSDAVCEGDIDRVVANRADDIVMFDVPEPLQEKGLEAYRNTWKLFFAHNPPGPERFRISELKIIAGDQVAFACGLLTIGGGDAHCRLTIGLQKVEGHWRVVHEHHSMPIKLT